MRKLLAWIRANKHPLAEATVSGFLFGLIGWLALCGIFELGNWLVPGLFGREPSGRTYFYSALISSFSIWCVREVDKREGHNPA